MLPDEEAVEDAADAGWIRPLHQPRARAPRTPPILWPLLAASILLALGAGTFSATAMAGPSSPLYGIHRSVENAQARLASSQAQRAQLHMQYATEALKDLDAAAKTGDQTGYATALATLQSETTAAKQSAAKVAASSDADALATQLNALHTQTWQDLAANLRLLNWNNRIATTLALGGLGARAPHVNAVTITQQAGPAQGNGQHGANSAEQVIVSGSGFEAGASLVANGQPAGQVSALVVTPSQIVATVSPGAIDSAQSIGVSNPDGTAAQTSAISRQADNDNGNTKHQSATPTASPSRSKGGHP